MEYKVVVTYYPDDVSKGQQCAILTVGVDKSWSVGTEHLSPVMTKQIFYKDPLITEGFMHWAMGDSVLTLNVEIEVITETPAPIPGVYGRENSKYYMSTGRYLSLLITCEKFLWEVWEMKPETGEWRKLPNIALEAQKRTIETFGCKDDDILIPVGWLNYLEVLIFIVSRPVRAFMIYYNLLTQEIGLIDLPEFTTYHKIVVHRNSLVWLSGC